MKVRLIAPQARDLAYPGGSMRVEPGEEVEVPDEVAGSLRDQHDVWEVTPTPKKVKESDK